MCRIWIKNGLDLLNYNSLIILFVQKLAYANLSKNIPHENLFLWFEQIHELAKQIFPCFPGGIGLKGPQHIDGSLVWVSPIRCSGGHWRHSLEWVVDHQRKMITSGVWILLMEEVPWWNGKQVNRACNSWAPSPALTLHKTDNIDHLEICPHHVSDSYPHRLVREQRLWC